MLALRFGLTRFPDNNTLSIAFDPTTLGFSSTYAGQIALQKFPQVDIQGYDQAGDPESDEGAQQRAISFADARGGLPGSGEVRRRRLARQQPIVLAEEHQAHAPRTDLSNDPVLADMAGSRHSDVVAAKSYLPITPYS